MEKVTVEAKSWVPTKEWEEAYQIASRFFRRIGESPTHEMVGIEIVKVTWGRARGAKLGTLYNDFLIVSNPVLYHKRKINIVARLRRGLRRVEVYVNEITDEPLGRIFYSSNDIEDIVFALIEALRIGLAFTEYWLLKDVVSLHGASRILFPHAVGRKQPFRPAKEHGLWEGMERFLVKDPRKHEPSLI